MIILITGSSSGIGKATAIKFLNEGHIVYGFDKKESTINHENYKHYLVDISDILSTNFIGSLQPSISIIASNLGSS